MAESKTRRKIAVILATDVVGFSTKMEENEEQTLKNLKVCRNIIDELIEEHHGRIFNTAGDSIVAEFQSAVEAGIFKGSGPDGQRDGHDAGRLVRDLTTNRGHGRVRDG